MPTWNVLSKYSAYEYSFAPSPPACLTYHEQITLDFAEGISWNSLQRNGRKCSVNEKSMGQNAQKNHHVKKSKAYLLQYSSANKYTTKSCTFTSSFVSCPEICSSYDWNQNSLLMKPKFLGLRPIFLVSFKFKNRPHVTLIPSFSTMASSSTYGRHLSD